MQTINIEYLRMRAAWAGRISGCMLGKPLEVLSFQQGREGIVSYLTARTIAVAQNVMESN